MANNEDTCPDSSFSCPLCQRTFPWSTPVPVTQETQEGRLHHLPFRYGLAFLKILVPILLFKPIVTTQFKAPPPPALNLSRSLAGGPDRRRHPQHRAPTADARLTIVPLKGVSFHFRS